MSKLKIVKSDAVETQIVTGGGKLKNVILCSGAGAAIALLIVSGVMSRPTFYQQYFNERENKMFNIKVGLFLTISTVFGSLLCWK